MRNFPLALVLGGGALLVAVNCTSNVTQQCAPNQQIACPCPGNVSGLQTCRADGSGYSLCSCSTMTTSASSTSAAASSTTGAGGATTASSTSTGMGMTTTSSSGTGGAPACAPSFAPIDLGPLSTTNTHTAVVADCNDVFVATNVDGAGAVNAVLTKYTMSGQVAGTKSFSGAFDQSIAALDTDGMGGVWVAANISGPVTLAGCPAIGAAGSSQFAVLHFDGSFNCLQAASFTHAAGTAIASIPGASGSVVIGGAGFPGCTLGWQQGIVDNVNAAVVARLTPMGTGFHTDWVHGDRTGDGQGVATVTGLAATTQNGGRIAVTGYMRGQSFYVGNLQGNSPTNGLSDDGFYEGLDAQQGLAGGPIGFLGGSGANADTHPNAIALDASGNSIVVGRAPSSFVYLQQPVPIHGVADGFAMMIKANFSPGWLQTFGGDSVDEATAVVSTTQGIGIAGTYSGSGTSWNVPACQKTLPGPNTPFVAALDGTGACVDNQIFPDMAGGAFAQSLAVNAKGAFMTGAFSGTLQIGNTMLVTQKPAEGFLASVALP